MGYHRRRREKAGEVLHSAALKGAWPDLRLGSMQSLTIATLEQAAASLHAHLT